MYNESTQMFEFTVLTTLDISSYDVETDETSTVGYYYIGRAPAGSSQAAAVWRIAKIADDGSSVQWADGDLSYNNVWNNRVSLSYSSS
jgi:hypothetical protein